MTKEELLKPRYKVIADYPDMQFPIDSIIEMPWVEDWFDDYPHLFKKLEWWEDRKIDELPPYIKIQDRVFKIKNYECYLGELIFKNEIDEDIINDTENMASIHWHFYKDKSTPATLEEYNAQQK